MKDYNLAKKICKEHGVKSFRKAKLKRTIYYAGKQCERINPHIAKRLLSRLESEGFNIGNRDVAYELAEKGLLDQITVC